MTVERKASASSIAVRAGVTAWFFGGAVGWAWVATVVSGQPVWAMVIAAVLNLVLGCFYLGLTVHALLEPRPSVRRAS